MSYENARYKNIGNDEGDVLNYFNNTLRNLIQKNGGDNTFATYTEDFHDRDIPFKFNERSRMMLTHPNHTISQIEKGFIELEIEFEVGFDVPLSQDNFINGDGSYSDDGYINQIFVGFKNAAEVISECRFYIDGKLINEYVQNEMIRESYAYNSIRSKDVKKGTSHSHSLWEDVIELSPNVAGVYIPLNDLLSRNDRERKFKQVTMELIIPFTDQLALQAWRLYPNKILGEIEEEIKLSLDGLVWCFLPPKNVAEVMKFRNFNNIHEYNAPDLPLQNHFVQIGNRSRIPLTMIFFDKPQAYGNQKYQCVSSIIQKAFYINYYQLIDNSLIINPSKRPEVKVGRTNLMGFGVKPEVIENLLSSLHEPVIIPSQELTRYIFEQKVNESGDINLKKFVPLKNATNITMMFPRHTNDCTVFENIMCKNVQLQVDKRFYPQIEFANTWDGRFIRYQLMANELDDLEPTKEIIESLSRPLNDLESFGRYFENPYDNTDFSINFQLERGNSGYVFDGLDTNTRDVLIQFKASFPKFTFTNANNTYYYPETTTENTVLINAPPPPSPEMWICSDTYWTWSVEDGVRYHHEGIPEGYE